MIFILFLFATKFTENKFQFRVFIHEKCNDKSFPSQ